MPLYGCQPPTGYADKADAWVNTGALLSRMNFALALTSGQHARRSMQRACDAADRAGRAAALLKVALADDVERVDRSDHGEGDDAGAGGGADARFAGIPEKVGSSMTSRRIFLKNGGLALVSLGFAPEFLARTAAAADARRKVLITIFQRGAVDGLNMIVPFGERGVLQRAAEHRHRAARHGAEAPRSISTASSASIRGWRRSSRSTTPARSRSSTPAARPTARARTSTRRTTWKRQRPGVKSTPDGWLNRYLHAREHAGGDAVPRGRARAAAAAIAAGPRAGARHRPDRPVRHPRRPEHRDDAVVVREPSTRRPPIACSTPTGREAFDAVKMLKDGGPGAATRRRTAPTTRARRTAQALRQIAQLIKADVGLEVAFAESGNWDHHVNEGAATGQLADPSRRLLAAASPRSSRDLGDRMSDVVILTMSEFGRAVAENGNRGTDHGHGNAMMVIGGGVRGGKVYGRWPGLAPEQRYEGRDLAVTTDFRAVFAEVVRATWA